MWWGAILDEMDGSKKQTITTKTTTKKALKKERYGLFLAELMIINW